MRAARAARSRRGWRSGSCLKHGRPLLDHEQRFAVLDRRAGRDQDAGDGAGLRGALIWLNVFIASINSTVCPAATVPSYGRHERRPRRVPAPRYTTADHRAGDGARDGRPPARQAGPPAAPRRAPATAPHGTIARLGNHGVRATGGSRRSPSAQVDLRQAVLGQDGGQGADQWTASKTGMSVMGPRGKQARPIRRVKTALPRRTGEGPPGHGCPPRDMVFRELPHDELR